MSIIIKPIVTEKMTAESEQLSRYGFIVEPEANKLQIKDTIEKTYNVTVTNVNTMRYLGKKQSRYTKGGMISGRKRNFKKAIVTIAEGENIDFFSNI